MLVINFLDGHLLVYLPQLWIQNIIVLILLLEGISKSNWRICKFCISYSTFKIEQFKQHHKWVAKAIFNQATMDIGLHTIDNFNKVLAEMIKHTFPAYAFREQKRYLRRHLITPRSMKLRSFISRLQELNPYF